MRGNEKNIKSYSITNMAVNTKSDNGNQVVT